MFHPLDQRFRTVATRVACGAVVFGGLVSSLGLIAGAGPALAQQPAAPVTAPAPATSPEQSPVDHVEKRLTELHKKLHITAAQEPQWAAFADASRANAKTMTDLLRQRAQQVSAGSAVDDMKSYSQLTDAHADGVRKLVPVFQALYDTMSPAQKLNADAVFRNMQSHGEHHRPAKPATP
ncbi:MAG TPA: Spy/CpxP family protein refolding chaperone [Stellaceae bacterium]|nr:Spy/CpxP family protein refolding chaperone [Stellaceae bacterium]